MAVNWKRCFFEKIATLDDRLYFQLRFRWELSEVTAGLKPASLMHFAPGPRNQDVHWENVGRTVASGLGLQSRKLFSFGRGFSVLTYDETHLKRSILKPENRAYLTRMGCPLGEGDPLGSVLNHFTRERVLSYPHEIGVLLGYGVKNVETFASQPGVDQGLTRYWRVFHDLDQARRLFDAIDQVRRQASFRLLSELEKSA